METYSSKIKLSTWRYLQDQLFEAGNSIIPIETERGYLQKKTKTQREKATDFLATETS